MKRILLLAGVALACLSVVSPSQAVSDQYKNIKLLWTAPTYPVCSFTATPLVSTACLNGYKEVLTPPAGTGGSSVTIPPCDATVKTSCIGPGAIYSWSPGGFLYVGTWNVTLAVAYLDASGAQQFTAAASTTAVVPNPFTPPSPATGLSANPAP